MKTKSVYTGLGLAMSALLFFLSANVSAQDSALQAELDAELKKVEDLKVAIDKALADIKKAKDNPKKSSGDSGGGEEDPLVTEALNLEDSIREKAILLNAYRKGFYVSSTVPKGTALGRVTLGDGTVLDDVVFEEVSRDGVKLKHKSGVAVVSGGNLPALLIGKVQVPPHNEALKYDLEILLAEKPKTLKPSDVLREERKRIEEEKLNARKKDYDEYLARNLARKEGRIVKDIKREGELEKRQMSRDQAAQRFLEINSEVQNLNAERKTWDRKLNVELRNRIKKEEEFGAKKIKPDPKVMESELGFIDKEISNIRAELDRIDGALRALRDEAKSLSGI